MYQILEMYKKAIGQTSKVSNQYTKETKFQVVEVEKPRMHEDTESAQAVAGLSAHPGFLYLLQKLKLQRALLETKLKKDRHETTKDFEFIQSGIFWTSWLEEQVNTAVFNKSRPTPQPATQPEIDAFETAKAALELVGVE